MIETMVAEKRRRATYQDVLDAPDDVVAEVIDGVLYLQPRPRVHHTNVSSKLGAALLRPPGEDGVAQETGWVVYDEPELHLGPEPDIVVPDIAAWRRGRFAGVDYDGNPAYVTVPPDWVCELLSPGTAKTDRMLKLPVYRREGVQWAWLVDATARLIDVFHARADGWCLVETRSGGKRERIPPFDEVALNLEWLWTP